MKEKQRKGKKKKRKVGTVLRFSPTLKYEDFFSKQSISKAPQDGNGNLVPVDQKNAKW